MRNPTTLAMLATVGLVAGCGSSWTSNDKKFGPNDCVEKNFFQDNDGDGWGDPDGEVITSCEQPSDNTAGNARDCDDDDDAITGRVGSACPEALAGGAEFVGMTTNKFEYIAFYGDTEVQRYTEAEMACAGWGQVTDGESQGSLAVFTTDADMSSFQGVIEDAVGNEPWAGFVGVGWSPNGADETTNGDWQWLDGADDLFGMPSCTSQLTPWDFFPRLDPNNSEHEKAIRGELVTVRLALVFDGSDWCVGLPADAGYTEDSELLYTRGHFACSRTSPDPEEYPSYAAPAAEE